MFAIDAENVRLNSYGHLTQVNLNSHTIKDLGITFPNNEEAIRTANLINRIISDFTKGNDK